MGKFDKTNNLIYITLSYDAMRRVFYLPVLVKLFERIRDAVRDARLPMQPLNAD